MTNVPDVATIDALMAQPFAVGIRREQMQKAWETFQVEATDYFAKTELLNAFFGVGTTELPPYRDLFHAALTRIVDEDAAREAEGRLAALTMQRESDAKWAEITRNASGLRRASLT